MSDSPNKSFTGKAAGFGQLLSRGWAVLLAATFLAVALPAAAYDEGGAKAGHAKHIDAKGDKCVRDEAYMRRNHMDLLKHQRDDTMRKGIRTTQYSLKNCIGCHANEKTNSVIGSTDGKDNFCQGCHNKMAVKLDCFECHSSKPKAASGDAMHPIVAPAAQPGDKDKQSGLSGKMRWQMQAKLDSVNKGEVVK
ncbi:MAG: hypothetical protein LLG15_05850 [Betaproteobacteria bacterium]|nr:hypothetical protein [Betaproteobacteria bacterium]